MVSPIKNRFVVVNLKTILDGEKDPAPYFFDKKVQSLLKILTRVNLAKVFRPKKLGDKKLQDPEYKFMTDEQLQEAMKKAEQKADEMLQIPPVVSVRNPLTRVFSKDPELQGLETSRMVFTDITFGIKDADRLIVVREPDGTLQEAEWDLRNRINQVYFPKVARYLKPPRMFEDSFEPNDPEYQRVVSITYQHVNDNDGFELLRSTRHFGALTFFLVWNRDIDNLLLELIETAHIEEAIEVYIEKYSNKKSALELGLQALKDLVKEREEMESGIKTAHGLS
ncbi:hypothetical protein NQ314_018022 [Rhamnusium bicolor]|uniref:28S ribosomal protein S22, mitochondrial n=1 Tax=Rhamnusium bicolor TaxID=1586634 RepID=A0AAV8WSA1_9CUCU|nr:hypothetical protein NQ314_018022 [Rhamnusium bicolor]